MAAKKKAKAKAKTKTRAAAAARARVKKPDRKAPAGMISAAPSLTVNDLQRSLAWYRDVLGFVVKDRWENNGTLLGVEMSAGKVLFMLGQDDWKKGRDRVKGQGVRIYCTTGQDVDRLAAKIKAGGGTLTQEPTDEWGMRSLSVDDPDGYKLTIASKLKR